MRCSTVVLKRSPVKHLPVSLKAVHPHLEGSALSVVPHQTEEILSHSPPEQLLQNFEPLNTVKSIFNIQGNGQQPRDP